MFDAAVNLSAERLPLSSCRLNAGTGVMVPSPMHLVAI